MRHREKLDALRELDRGRLRLEFALELIGNEPMEKRLIRRALDDTRAITQQLYLEVRDAKVKR